MQDIMVSRLENLFWRIWGSVALQQSLTGITLATIFMAIHENSSLDVAYHHQSLPDVSLENLVAPFVCLKTTS